MLCAVPVGRLSPGTAFLFQIDGTVEVGAVIRPGWGYTQVVYAKGQKHNEFLNRKGELQEFDSYGFRKDEWSSGTLVRPLLSEGEMSEQVESNLVSETPSVSTQEIKDKVAKLKARAAAAAPSKGKAPAAAKGKAAVAKAPREAKPKEENPCTCGCGGVTGGRFCPGHDARYYGWLKKIVKAEMEFRELPKPVQKALVDIKGVKKALEAHNTKH